MHGEAGAACRAGSFEVPASAVFCSAAGHARTDVFTCDRASCGHPNALGAAQDARQIAFALWDPNAPPPPKWDTGEGAEIEAPNTDAEAETA